MKGNVDMTEGKITGKLLLFILPMLLSSLFQQLYNIVDSIVAGYISKDALAAVGSSGTVTFLFVAVGNGCAAGAAVIAAKYFGAKQMEKLKSSITTSFITIFSVSAVLTTLGLVFCDWILRVMDTKQEIFLMSSQYLSIYFVGLTFLFTYNICNGIFSALGDSKTPLYFLIFSSILNVVLDLFFAFKLKMGVAGLAWATTIAQGISSLLSLGNLVRVFVKIEAAKYPKFDNQIFVELIQMSIPSILSSSAVSFGQLGVQRLINGFNTDIIAGYTAAMKISGIFTMAICTVSNSISKFAGQNFGAKKYKRIAEGFKIGNFVSVSISMVALAILAIFSTPLLKLFGDDTVTIDMLNAGKSFLVIVSPFYIALAFKVVADGCVQGCMKTKVYSIGTIVDLAVRVGLSYALAPTLGFTGVCIAFGMGWLIGGTTSVIVYKFAVVDDVIKKEEKLQREISASLGKEELDILLQGNAVYDVVTNENESVASND